MGKFLFVDVAQAVDNLTKDETCHGFRQTSSILYKIEEFTLLAQLRHDEEPFTLRLAFENKLISAGSKHSEDIWVLKVL